MRCVAVINEVRHNIVWGIGILAPPLAAGAHLLVEKVPCADGMKPPLKPVGSRYHGTPPLLEDTVARDATAYVFFLFSMPP